MPPLSMIKSLTSQGATMVSSLAEYSWMLNKLLLMEKPCAGSIFARGKERTQAVRSQRVWKTLLFFRIFDFWFLEWKPLVKGRFFIFIFWPLRSVFRHPKRNLVWYFWWKNQWVILGNTFEKKKSTELHWSIVATTANYLMVLFSSSLGNFILVGCLLNKLFHTNT